MSSKKTKYLNMHDWIGTDPWRRSEISENFQKLDDKSEKLDQSMTAATAAAGQAKATAEGIDAKAESALNNSTSAVTNANAAVQTASAADAKATTAKTTSEAALTKAQSADATAASVQNQFNQVVINGDSSIEAAQARVDTSGQTYTTLKQRLDSEHQSTNSKLAETAKQTDVRLKAVKLEPEDLSPETLGLVTGTGSVSVLSIPQNKSVGHEKTTFLETGKKKFDKSKRTIGYWVDSATGSLVYSASYDSSDYIPVSGGITYHLTKFRNYALYDLNKAYLSGLNNTAYANATFTPAQDGFIRFATGNTFVDTAQLEVGSAATVYEAFKYEVEKLKVNNGNLTPLSVSKDKLQLGIVDEKHIDTTSNIVIKKPSKNKLDISKVTAGFYVDYTNGNLVANADNKATDYIPLAPNTTYTLSNQSPQVTTKDLGQIAFYNSSKAFVSGMANTGAQQAITFTTGANVYYVRVSIPVIITDGFMIEEGSSMTEYEPYEIKISKSDLPSEMSSSSGKTLTVKKDGTGDFTSLRMAIASATDASKKNPYTIEIHEGTYDIFGYYTAEEINNASFDGLRKPDYVSLVGIGDKEKTILKGEFPTEDTVITYASKGRISTLCPLGNGDIENLTITGKNLRYAVHDDYNYPNAKMIVKNCDIIHYLGDGRNYGGKQAWGEGTWNGQSRIFEDCTFVSEWDYYAYTTHNTAGQTVKSSHKFINCKEVTKGMYGLRFSSLDGQLEEIDLIGNKSNGGIHIEPVSPYTGNKFKIRGYGNDVMPVKFANTDGIQHTYEFVGETQEMYNGSGTPILKGQPVMLNSSGTSIVLFTGSGKIRFYGIALEDIPTGTNGVVKTNGFLAISDTALTGLVVGDTIGIVNGALAKVTTADYIGVVTLTDYIRLG